MQYSKYYSVLTVGTRIWISDLIAYVRISKLVRVCKSKANLTTKTHWAIDFSISTCTLSLDSNNFSIWSFNERDENQVDGRRESTLPTKTKNLFTHQSGCALSLLSTLILPRASPKDLILMEIVFIDYKPMIIPWISRCETFIQHLPSNKVCSP